MKSVETIFAAPTNSFPHSYIYFNTNFKNIDTSRGLKQCRNAVKLIANTKIT